ncbi:four-carbon acid sugar kinase family protein [Ciceribacter sp. L1K23]|uniref:four-carbon acid sugar kinase family protein n=1 Tax=Ciceribacter sp. L1K23 TaxID=2820276 RepID=UPI001B822072|nr:four-carbon acid sugar kinase family protein [Ciceribacter sp. L1K23]MBR0558380.1 four-carbon acid sugar kinase family protein [Ciceribacter sp. L1K23]
MLAIVADDLTGALDTGSPFAGRGLHTEVAIGVEAIADALAEEPAVLSINLGSREFDEAHAAALARAAYQALPRGTRIFKKVDSRLKGHVAAELDAISYRKALVAPAIPAFGRIVRDGCVEGFGVARPIRIADRLGGHAERCRVADTVSDADMDAALETAEREDLDLLVGARGLAEALARRMTGGKIPQSVEPPEGAGLFVIGSHDPITLAQVETLRARGDVDYLSAPNGRLGTVSPKGGRVVLVQATQGSDAVSAQDVSACLAGGVHPELTSRARTLLLSGGATAEAVLSRMGVRRFRLHGECLPGLGLAYAGDQCIIAKSGGFGAPDTLAILASRILRDMD